MSNIGNSIQVSDAFHRSVKNGEKQRLLVYFPNDNLYLTNDDITASGIKYENYFCPEEEFFIGLTQSASISFSIFNENHRLDNMSFGKFVASMGVVTSRERYNRVGSVCVENDGDQIVGYHDEPYLRVNGIAITDQPNFPVESILNFGGVVYCIGANGEYAAYRKMDYETGEWGSVAQYVWGDLFAKTWNDTLNSTSSDGQYHQYQSALIPEIMIDTVKRYAKRNVGIVVGNDKTIIDYLSDGTKETYTYVDLGVFYAEKPARTRVNIISIEGHDALSLFDISTETMDITFPITLKALLDRVCEFVGIENKAESFINDDIEIQASSDIFQNTTAREVVGFIAESACANAKIDYDGKLYLAWWEESDLVLDESDYFDFVPYEYSVNPIDRLQVRNSDSDIGILVGSGTNGYVIQENPFLSFHSDAEGRGRTEKIYNRLSSFSDYIPGTVSKWFADWSYRPGDIISVYKNGVIYRYPVFGYSMNWSGMATATVESKGNEYREILDEQHREAFVVGRKMLEIEKTIDGVSLTASEAVQKSDGALEKVAKLELTVDGFSTSISKIEEGQEELSSEFKQVADSIELKVSQDEIISAINLSKENVKIKAPKIEFDGAVITNSTLETGNWKFDQNGSNYSNGGQSVNMTVMSGDFVGGGSGSRAFFGSTGLDVQYGADYSRTAFMRAGDIQFILQNSSEMSDYVSAGFKRSNSGEICFVCKESEGASNTDENSSGNLGYSDQYWDYTFTRVLRAGTYPGSSSRKIKQDIEPIPVMGDLIDRLEPVSFAYKNAPNTKRYGLIYEDVKNIIPVVCFDDGKGDPGIVYTDLIPVLIKEIQELRKRIVLLEERG